MGDIVVIDFGGHVELVAEFLVGVGLLPVFVRRIGHGAQFLPHLGLHVLDRVGAEAVHAELADPVRVPLHQVVARRARVAGLGKELVELLHLLRVAPFAAPFFHQLRRQFHLGVAVGADVRQVFHQRAINRGFRVFIGAGGVGAHPVLRPHRVDRSHGAGMVHHHVEDHADAARMGRLDEIAEIVFGAEAGVHRREVAGPVAVKAIRLAGAFVGAGVDLFDRRREPDGVHTQCVEVTVVDLVDQACQVATHETAQRRGILLAAVGQVVAGKGIIKTVGQHEIHGGVFPQEGLGRLGRHDGRRAFLLDAGGLGCGVAAGQRKRGCCDHLRCQGNRGPPCQSHAVFLIVLRGNGRTRASGPAFDAGHLLGKQDQGREGLLGW